MRNLPLMRVSLWLEHRPFVYNDVEIKSADMGKTNFDITFFSLNRRNELITFIK